MRVVSVRSNTLRNALTSARRLLELNPRKPEGHVKVCYDHGESLYRVVFRSGDVAEVTLRHGVGPTEAYLL